MDSMPYETIITIINELLSTSDVVVIENFWDAITNLIGSVKPTEERHFDFLWDLLTITSRVRCYEAKSTLLPMMNRGQFRRKFGRRQDLHYRIIEVLSSLGLSLSETYILFKRDLECPEYVDIVFKSMHRAKPQSWVKYLPIVTRIIRNLDRPGLRETIILEDLNIVDNFGYQSFVEDFFLVLKKLSDEEIDFLLRSLEKAYPDQNEDILSEVVRFFQSRGGKIYNADKDGLVFYDPRNEIDFGISNIILYNIWAHDQKQLPLVQDFSGVMKLFTPLHGTKTS